MKRKTSSILFLSPSRSPVLIPLSTQTESISSASIEGLFMIPKLLFERRNRKFVGPMGGRWIYERKTGGLFRNLNPRNGSIFHDCLPRAKTMQIRDEQQLLDFKSPLERLPAGFSPCNPSEVGFSRKLIEFRRRELLRCTFASCKWEEIVSEQVLALPFAWQFQHHLKTVIY